MPGLSRAERVLGLFTTPARAEAIAGDLAEAHGGRGGVRLWRDIGATALALCGQTIARAPRDVLHLVVTGYVLFTAATFAGVAGVSLFPWLLGPAVASLVLSALWWGCAFGAGSSLVGMQPARGMAACVVLAAIIEVSLAAALVAGFRPELPDVSTAIFTVAAAVAPLHLVFGGAVARSRVSAFVDQSVAQPR